MADHVDYGRDRHKTVVILQLKRKKFFFFFLKALFYLTFSCFLLCCLRFLPSLPHAPTVSIRLSTSEVQS